MSELTTVPTRHQYWLWGLPSLLLAGVAIVVFLLSEMIVQPQITAHYQLLSDRSMQQLEKNEHDIEAFVNNLRSQSDRDVQGLEFLVREQLQGVERMQLIQKRLATIYPDDSTPYWTTAVASELGANACIMASRMARRDEQATEEATQDWLDRSMHYKNSMNEALTRASRRDGVGRNRATTRLLQRALEQDLPALVDQTSAMHEAGKLLESLKAGPVGIAEIPFLESHLALLKALNPLDLLSDDDRKSLAHSVTDGLAAMPNHEGVIEKATKLDRDALLEPEFFLTQAREILPIELKRSDASDIRLPARIDAMFRIMIPLMGVDEAFQYVRSRSQEVALIEVPQLKNLVAWSSIRFMQAKKAFPSSVYSRIDLGRLLKELVIFSSESAVVMDILACLLVEREKPCWQILDESFKSSEGSEVHALATALRNTLNQTGFTDSESLKNSDPRLVVAFLPSLAHLTSKGDVQYSELIFLLNKLQESHPMVPDIQFMRAVMASKHGDLDQAIEDFTELNQKFPGNRSVVSMLERLRMQGSSGR